jgi:deoxyribose-phosphate aldolase
MSLTKPLNRYIDHTLLAPAAMDVAFESHLEDAVKHDFYSVVVSPYIALPTVRALASYPSIKVGTVVAFPHGNIPLLLKLQQVSYFIQGGVHEIDWVLHYTEAFNERWKNIVLEMGQIADLCRQGGVVSKCIVESGVITNTDLLARLFTMVRDTGVDFIKTSTGFTGPGASVGTIKLWNKLRGGSPTPYIKASGGIKSAERALAMIDAGADRLGLSASVEVMEQYNAATSTFTEREEKD